MKKLVLITITTLSIFFILPSIISPVIGQDKPKDEVKITSIPDSVMKIINTSCIACHKDGGNGMAASRVNFTKWETYSPEKKANKSDDMCAIITKGKMPPKKYKASHPEAVLTEANIKIICDWSKSLQVAKE